MSGITKTVARTGWTQHVQIDGPDGAPWLILSNSLGTNLTMWDPQMDALTTNFRVLRYDTRGHGQTGTPREGFTLDDLAGDVIALMDHFDIATAAFMGLSMGGMTGLGLARHHPDRITRVVCADGRADAPEGFRTMWDSRIAAVETGGLAAIVEGTCATWLTPDWFAVDPARTPAIHAMILGNDPAGYIACCRALQGLDHLRHLGEVTIPVLYVGGSEDKGAAPEVMQAMADATPASTYKQIPGAAHIANINQPEAFTAAVLPFLIPA